MTARHNYSSCEQFKWTLLDHAEGNIKQGIGDLVAREMFPDASELERDAIVRKALLELFDDGLIAFFRGNEEEGSSATIDQITELDRVAVVRELDRPRDYVDPPDAILFFTETPKGARVFRTLPPSAVWRK